MPKPETLRARGRGFESRQIHSRFLTVRFDTEKLNLIKWPFAAIVWSLTGLFVSMSGWPNVLDTFVTVGQFLSILVSVMFAVSSGLSLGWILHRMVLIDTQLWSVYSSRYLQLYRASGVARKKLRKSWGDQL